MLLQQEILIQVTKINNMKFIFIMLAINAVVGYCNIEKSSTIEDSLYNFDSSQNSFSDKTVTITFSYAAIACNCPQWFETKNKNIKFLKDVERFYLEPKAASLLNANKIWDGEHLPLTLKATGNFSKEKLFPRTYGTKGEPVKARIFWYNKITVVSPSGL